MILGVPEIAIQWSLLDNVCGRFGVGPRSYGRFQWYTHHFHYRGSLHDLMFASVLEGTSEPCTYTNGF